MVYDVTNPAQPLELNRLQTSGKALDIAVEGDLVFCAQANNGLGIYDFSDPLVPDPVGFLALPRPGQIGLHGSTLYLSHYSQSGFDVLDVASPAAPQLTGSVTSSGILGELDVVDGLLYTPDAGGGLKIYDLATPESPALLSTFPVASSAHGVDVAGHLAAVAGYASGVRVLNVADPEHPAEVAWHEVPAGDNVQDVTVQGTLVVAALTSGIATYRIGGAVAVGEDLPVTRLLAWPNPFRGPALSIGVTLGPDGRTRVEAYDVAGRRVRAWHVAGEPAARREVRWDGTDRGGRAVAPGVYFLRAATAGGSATTRVLRLP